MQQNPGMLWANLVTNPPGPGPRKKTWRPEWKTGGLDWSMMQFPVEYDPINEVDGIEEWERVNKFGVYLFKWNEKHRLAFQVRKAAHVYEDEVAMLLHSGRYFLVAEGNRQRLFGEQGASEELELT